MMIEEVCPHFVREDALSMECRAAQFKFSSPAARRALLYTLCGGTPSLCPLRRVVEEQHSIIPKEKRPRRGTCKG